MPNESQPELLNDAEEHYEQHIRPKSLKEFIGQDRLKRNLAVFVKAAKMQNRPLPHMLFYGPPGLGKTTLSRILAHEMSVNIRVTSGPILEKPGDIAAILSALEAGDILFIDEIHRLRNNIEEILYPALEEFELDLVVGQGPGATTVRLPLNRFTLIGATTKAGNLTSPLKARFGYEERLSFYEVPAITRILERTAGILGICFATDSAKELARRCRGTPRVANRLLARVRDFAVVQNCRTISMDIIDQALTAMKIDHAGLTHMDLDILHAVIDRYDGGPVGLDTIAVSVGEDKRTIEEVFEPFLIKMGFISRTPRGRMATRLAYKHLGKEQDAPFQGSLYE